MKKFDFLIGEWSLEYRVPKSAFSEAATGTGSGTFARALDGKFVFFDYSAVVNGQNGSAHGVFGWDEKIKAYRYWWFENSGSFMTAACNFINDKTLYMNWHDTLLVQTFEETGAGKVTLRMGNPDSRGKFELILEVLMTRK
jgi:hypothetical protein